MSGSFAKDTPLWKIVVGESTCALITGALVAPAIALVDQSIFSSASGRESMMACIKRELKSPLVFLRSPACKWIFAVYSTTYIAANVGESLYQRAQVAHVADTGQMSASTETATFKFAVTSATNITMSMAKDRAFARIFGAVGHAPHAVPVASLALFGLRDCITVGASFTLVPHVAAAFHEQFGVSKSTADVTAQLLTPCAAQIFNTPLYILGLSLYNQPEHTLAQRAQFLRSSYVRTVLARWARIFPAFGIGGVVNKKLRTELHKWK